MKKLVIKTEIKEVNPVNNKITKSEVFINVKECGLDFMLYRGFIKNNQHKAGIHFRSFFEKASIGGYKSIDLQKGRISGTPSGSIPDSVLGAMSSLHNARDLLGEQGYKVAVYVCGQNYSLIETRKILNIKPRYMGERLREVLTDLANLYGYGNT
tara:strand:+ start:38 stop:502 length:465 start_codon:yes stop_codon:yes gene_type:complete